MTRDVAKYVRDCHVCKLSKPCKKTKVQMKITDTPLKTFDVVEIDLIGPLPKSNNGFVYAVTLICELTKYLVAIPITEKKADVVARAIFEKFVLAYGPMRAIRTDRGSEFICNTMQELCSIAFP